MQWRICRLYVTDRLPFRTEYRLIFQFLAPPLLNATGLNPRSTVYVAEYMNLCHSVHDNRKIELYISRSSSSLAIATSITSHWNYLIYISSRLNVLDCIVLCHPNTMTSHDHTILSAHSLIFSLGWDRIYCHQIEHRWVIQY